MQNLQTTKGQEMNHFDKELFERYVKLSDFYKQIVQLLALAHEPMNTSMTYKCLQRLGIRPTGKRLISADISHHLYQLEAEDFIKKVHGATYEINTSIEDEVVKDLYKGREFNYFSDALQSFMPVFSYSTWSTIPMKRYYRSIRIALLKGDFIKIKELSYAGRRHHGDKFDVDGVYNIIIESQDDIWLSKLPENVIARSTNKALTKMYQHFDINPPFLNFIEKTKLTQASEYSTIFRETIIWTNLFQGNFESAEAINSKNNKEDSRYYSFLGVIDFMKGNIAKAQTNFFEALQQFKKENRKQKAVMPHLAAQFLYLSLLEGGNINHSNLIGNYLNNISFNLPLNSTLAAMLYMQKNQMNLVRTLFQEASEEGLAFLFLNYAKRWIYADQADINIDSLETLFKQAADAQLHYFVFLIADLLAQVYLEKENTNVAEYYKAIKNDLNKKYGFTTILLLVPVVEPWERAINALVSLSSQFEAGDLNLEKDHRLIWLINFKAQTLEAKEQKIGKNGKWTKGRTASLDKLRGITDEDFVSDQDILIINSLEEVGWGYNSSEFDFNPQLIKALIGHPNLYLNNTQRTAVEIVLEQPQLIVNQIGDKYELKFNIEIESEGIRLVKETPTRYKAIEITEQHLMIVNAIGNNRVVLPPETANQLTQIVKGFSKVVNVQSDLLAEDVGIRKVESSSKIHIHLLPMGDGFQMEMYVKPFGEHPPYYKPADGGKVILAEIEGERLQTERDLDVEKERAKAIIKSCPSLGNIRKLDKIWEFQTPEECLEILTELEPLKIDDQVVVEWPKGERLKLRGVASIDQFAMSIRGSTDWFEASGTLKVGEDLVMNMKEVLKLLENNDSRFIQLKNGEFLALTNRFKQQLKALEAYSDPTKDGLRFHPLAAFAVEDLTSETKELEVDAAWQAQLKRLKDAEKKTIKLPSTFQAELRPYQVEGYNWLMKLSNWGVGACLADDMGLGKTVQALAAILTKAKDGPALVVCPASVRINWEREAQKFAPTLNPIQFGEGNREEILNDLKPYDLLITSYGLVTTEEEKMSKIQFSSIVLDEAQAIKNRAAKRSKAAMALNGDFKIITTGTPIENHLGELWNLFRFINPGLLGLFE